MTLTTHGIAGGIIASSIPDPALGLSLSLLSHPILDLIPHWDLGIGWRKQNKLLLFSSSLADFTAGAFVAHLLFPEVNLFYLLACVFMASLPDGLCVPYMFLNWKSSPFSWIWDFQSKVIPYQPLKLIPGVLTQIGGLIVLYLVLKLVV